MVLPANLRWVFFAFMVGAAFLFELSFAFASDALVFIPSDWAWPLEQGFWLVTFVPLGFWTVWDYRTLEFVLASFVFLLLYLRLGSRGVVSTALKGVQVMSLLLVVFPAEILAFSPAMFKYPLCNAVAYHQLQWINLQWLTNGVFMAATLFALFASSALLWALRGRR